MGPTRDIFVDIQTTPLNTFLKQFEWHFYVRYLKITEVLHKSSNILRQTNKTLTLWLDAKLQD